MGWFVEIEGTDMGSDWSWGALSISQLSNWNVAKQGRSCPIKKKRGGEKETRTAPRPLPKKESGARSPSPVSLEAWLGNSLQGNGAAGRWVARYPCA